MQTRGLREQDVEEIIWYFILYRKIDYITRK